MAVKRDASFERAVRIEMLRAKAAVERHTIAAHARTLADDFNIKRVVTGWLPGQSGGLLSQGIQLASRYPYIISSLFSSRRFRTIRWVSVLAVGALAWGLVSGNRHQDDDPAES
jgi:hypothetical protein